MLFHKFAQNRSFLTIDTRTDLLIVLRCPKSMVYIKYVKNVAVKYKLLFTLTKL